MAVEQTELEFEANRHLRHIADIGHARHVPELLRLTRNQTRAGMRVRYTQTQDRRATETRLRTDRDGRCPLLYPSLDSFARKPLPLAATPSSPGVVYCTVFGGRPHVELIGCIVL